MSKYCIFWNLLKKVLDFCLQNDIIQKLFETTARHRTSCSSLSKKVEKTWKKFLTNESTYGIMYESPIQSEKRNRDISTRTLKIKQRWKGTRLIKSLETPGTRVPKTVITYRFERIGRTIKISSSRKGILIQSFKSLILAQDERWRRA